MTSEADEAIRLLRRFVQLSESRQLPASGKIRCRALVALRLAGIQYTTTQACGDADHAVQLVGADETAPFGRHVQFVLCRDDVRRRAVHAILIEEQPDDFMSAGKRGFGKAQRTTSGGRMGRGEQGDCEFHRGTMAKQST